MLVHRAFCAAIVVLMLPRPAWAAESTATSLAGAYLPGLEELRGTVLPDAHGATRTVGAGATAVAREKVAPGGLPILFPSGNASASTDKDQFRDEAIPPRAKRPGRTRGSVGDQEAGINTWSIFGFTEGSDVDEQGGRTVYTDSIGQSSRREANYAALHGSLGYGYSPTDHTNIWIEAVSEYEQADGVAANPPSGLASSVAFGTSIGIKHQILDRAQDSIGLSVEAAPYWQRSLRVDGSGRETVGSELRVLADVALVPERVFGAVNLVYTPEFNATGRETERTSSLEASAAVAGCVGENVFVGAELRNLTIHDGAFFEKFLGWALYAGPTFYLSLAGKGYVAAAWSEQLVGKAAGESGAHLDLINHERHQFRVKTGFYL